MVSICDPEPFFSSKPLLFFVKECSMHRHLAYKNKY